MFDKNYVWVFSGEAGRFPSGIFVEKNTAEVWIREHNLTGVLTKYPLNEGVYSWAIRREYFTPRKPHEFSSEFIQQFSCASQEHFHYENGQLD